MDTREWVNGYDWGPQKLLILEYKHETMYSDRAPDPCKTIADVESFAISLPASIFPTLG